VIPEQDSKDTLTKFSVFAIMRYLFWRVKNLSKRGRLTKRKTKSVKLKIMTLWCGKSLSSYKALYKI